MPLNSPKRPPYWISTSGSISTHHRSRHVILYQSAKFYPNHTTLGRKKMMSCRFSRWRISGIMDFRNPIMGSLKSPITITQSTCSWGTSRVLSASSAQHSTSGLSLTAGCQWPTWRQSVAQHTVTHLRQIRPTLQSLSRDAAKTFQAFISSRLDYCNSVLYAVTDNLLLRLQSVQTLPPG